MNRAFDGMKGYMNSDYPDAKHNYDDTVAEIRKHYKKPIFSF